MTFAELQNEQRAWVEHNFPHRIGSMPLLGVVEEVGELAHAELKGQQGIRHTPEAIFAMKMDAIGDIVIFLADYCSANSIDFDHAVTKTWAEVIQRDWIARPMDANKVGVNANT